MTRGRKAVLTGLLIAVALFLVLGALLLFLRQRPIFTDAEVAEHSAAIEQARADTLEMDCSRVSIFGPSLESEHDPIDLLTEDGGFSDCREAARAARVALGGTTPQGRWRWDVPDSELPEAALPEAAFLDPGVPLYRREETPPEFDRVAEACAALSARIDELARDGSHCSPLAPHDTRLSVDMELFPTARALSVLARLSARGGDTSSALRLLIQGVAVIRDFRLGPAALLPALTAAAAEGVLWSAVQNLLNQTDELEPGFRREFLAALEALSSIQSSAHHVYFAEAIALYDHALASTRDAEMARPLAAASLRFIEDLDSWCPAGNSHYECLGAVPTPETWDQGDTETLSQIFGNRVLRRPLMDQMVSEIYRSAPRMLGRLKEAEMMRRAIQISLELMPHRAADRCPDQVTLPPELVEDEDRSAPIEVRRLSGSQFEIIPPLLPFGASRPVVIFLCPMPPGGTWNAWP